MIETTSVDGPYERLERGAASRNDCGFTATTSVSTSPVSLMDGLSRMPCAASALISSDGCGLDHHDGAAGIETLRQPSGQHRAAHLAGAGKRDGAVDVFEGCWSCEPSGHTKSRVVPCERRDPLTTAVLSERGKGRKQFC
jgi:hypothetical protein